MRHIGGHGKRDEEQLAVIKRLEEDIIFRRFMPGSRLTEDVLMERYTASRHYVRQALRQMERLGIVQHVKNVGATVFAFTREDIENIYQVFEIILRLVVQSLELPATDALIAELERLNAIHGASYDGTDPRAMHSTNDAFHCALLSTCKNRYLHKTLQDYTSLTLPMRAKIVSDPDFRDLLLDQHVQMIELMKGDDHFALADLCVEHMRPGKTDYLRFLDSIT